jgi:prenyltransferase beta subunit
MRTSRMRLAMLVFVAVAASGVLLSVTAAAQPSSRTNSADQFAAVQAALDWLRTQQQPDGGFNHGLGSDPDSTIEAVLALSAGGRDPHEWSSVEGGPSVVDYLVDQAAAYASTGAGAIARLTLAAVCADEEPRAFGGLDLPSQLAAAYEEGTGVYGSGLSDQVWAMLALGAVRMEVPSAATDWLAAQQGVDGGFDMSGLGPDTDSTALAIQALVTGGRAITSTTIVSGVNYLKSQQSATGGFPLALASGPDSNARSTACGIQALVAAGEDPVDQRWAVGGGNPVQDLLGFQDPGGAFELQLGGGEDLLGTARSIVALTGRPLPLAGRRVAATEGLEWLRTQQSDDGSFGNVGLTAQAVLAIGAAGERPTTWRSPSGASALDYLAANLDQFDKAGKTGRLLSAVAAASQNPYSFGGQDVIQKLMAFYDSATGQFDGAGNVIEHALAIMGLESAWGTTPPEAVEWLKAHQNGDGGWGWAVGAESDTNSTALALQALIAAGEPVSSTAVMAAVPYLTGQQNNDGGFPWVKPSPWGTDSDANSTSTVVQGLLAAGEDPASSAWTRTLTATGAITLTWRTPYESLMGFQTADGAFQWQLGMGADLLATVQSIPALLRASFPQRGSHLRAVQDALAWLKAQQQADGSFPAAAGHDADATVDVVFAVACAGGDPEDWSLAEGPSMLDYLESVAPEYATNATATARLVLAALCGDRDPADFGGLDLVGDLAGRWNEATGSYGSNPGDQEWALLAMSALGEEIRSAALEWLRGQQQRNGGFQGPGQLTTTAGEPMTSTVVGDAVGYLRSQQSPTGGFPPPEADAPNADAASTAYCIQALVAGGEDPLGTRWTVQGRTPLDDLLRFQLPSGAFERETGAGESIAATARSIPGMLSKPFPVCDRVWQVFLPLMLQRLPVD